MGGRPTGRRERRRQRSLQRAVPSEDRLRSNDGDSREKRGEDLGQGREGQPITGLEPGVGCGSPEDDDLLAEESILGEEGGAGAEHAREGSDQAGHQFVDHRGRVSADVGP
jgi:hypothetical protein